MEINKMEILIWDYYRVKYAWNNGKKMKFRYLIME